MKRLLLTQFCLVTWLAISTIHAESLPGSNSLVNPLVWDATEKKQELPGMTNLALFTFWVTNRSEEAAAIISVEAECECTVIDARTIFPWVIAPGSGGPLNLRVNIRGRFGLFVKTVTVHTSHGPQVLTVSMKIPLTPAPSNVSARQRDVIAAKADRQSVFRGNCAPCHAAPTVGLSGAALFEKACAICHQAERRAEMVPDLASLKHSTDADYWRNWITSGKTGSLMPAFARAEGGILDTDQIESLVDYTMKRFPPVGPSALSSRPAPNPPEAAAASTSLERQSLDSPSNSK